MLLTSREQLNKLSCVGYTADVNIEVLARGTAGFSGKKYVLCVSTVHSSVSVRPWGGVTLLESLHWTELLIP